MESFITRRDLLRFLGGSLAGILVTPLPWKLLDDSAIWTQTGPLVTKLPRGPITVRSGVCSLCPAGCGFTARCVGGIPVSLRASEHDPAGGSLCAAGLAGHYSAYHPLRVRQPLKLNHREGETIVSPAEIGALSDEVQTILHQSLPVALLDMRPGRTVSLYYRSLLADANGAYIVPSGDEIAPLASMMSGHEQYAYDIQNASSILSFAAPLFDGWGTPGTHRFLRDSGIPSVQIESRRSRTAALAREWIRLKPGTEGALALGLGHIIVSEGLFDSSFVSDHTDDFRRPQGRSYCDLVARFTPALTEELTEIPAGKIQALARKFAKERMLAIPGGDPANPLGSAARTAIWDLNILTGRVGRRGGVIPRAKTPLPAGIREEQLLSPTSLEEVPDGSISLLLIDGSGNLPWKLVEKKLRKENRLVVCFSPVLSGIARYADYVIPAPAHLESWTDLPEPADLSHARFVLSSPLITPRADVIDPLTMIGRFFSRPTETAAALHERVNAIRSSGKGNIISRKDGSVRPAGKFSSSDDLWNTCAEEGTWINGSPVRRSTFVCSLLGRNQKLYERMLDASNRTMSGPHTLTLIVTGPDRGLQDGQSSPILTKIYQESRLRPCASDARIHPALATRLDLRNGDRALLETRGGALEVRICEDPMVAGNSVEIAAGPDPVTVGEGGVEYTRSIMDILEPDANGLWRGMQAELRKV